jgi:hypothetical protein
MNSLIDLFLLPRMKTPQERSCYLYEFFDLNFTKNFNKFLFMFCFLGKEAGQWYLDLKNGAGSCGAGVAHCSPDVTMSLKDTDFTKMFSGTSNYTVFRTFYAPY